MDGRSEGKKNDPIKKRSSAASVEASFQWGTEKDIIWVKTTG